MMKRSWEGQKWTESILGFTLNRLVEKLNELGGPEWLIITKTNCNRQGGDALNTKN